GRTLLMSRTALKGTTRRTAVQIAEDGELLGGSVGAMVGGDSVGWTISVPKQHTAAAVELLADVAQNPTFETQALETERAIALADLAARHVHRLRFGDTPALPRPTWPDHLIETIEQREKAQTALVMSFPSPARSETARFDVAILSGVASGLGGRLFEELRDKQSLCYTVHAFSSER